MSSEVAKPAGATRPSQFRLEAETIADINLIRDHYGQSSRTDAVRLAVKREADRIRRQGK